MWDKMLTHWDDWHHPLRPNVEEVATFTKLLENSESRLLLGQTEELLQLSTLYADKQQGLDWFNLPYAPESFDIIFGDGILLVASGPQIIAKMQGLLKPTGRLVLRTFLYNDSPVVSDNFLIRKWQHPGKTYLPVQELYDRFGDTPTTKDYNGSKDVYYFPRLEELTGYSQVYYPSYDFGQYFPIIVWNK